MQAQLSKATQEWASAFVHMPWDKYWRALPKILEIVLVILLAKAAAEVTWLILAPADDTTATPAANLTPAKPAAPQARLAMVANLHLFGIPMQNLAPGIDARETGLKLTLRGVFSSSVPQHSMAIIADQAQQEKVYGHGDSVVPGVVLYEVHPDKIILERSGSFETLSMPREGKDKPPVIAPVGAAAPAYAPPPVPGADAGQRLKALRSDLVNQPQKFWDQVRIDPYMEGGQLKGFRFNHRDPQMLQSMGLTPSDVIIDVNGSPATDPALLQNMMGTGEQDVTLGVLRNGQRVELRISM